MVLSITYFTKRQASAKLTFPSCPSITAFPTVILPFTFLMYNNNQSTYGFLLHKPGGIHFCTKTGILILKTPPQNAAISMHSNIGTRDELCAQRICPKAPFGKLQAFRAVPNMYSCNKDSRLRYSDICRMFFVCLYYSGTLRQIQEKIAIIFRANIVF